MRMKWISVKDELPHNDIHLHQWVTAINVNDPDPTPFVVGFTIDWDGNPSFECLRVTHWIPIPPTPEEIEGITFEEAEQFYGTKESEE